MTVKVHVVQRIVIGIALSLVPIIGLIESGMNASYILPILFIVIWNVGEVYAVPYYLKKVENKFTSILKLSIISYLTIGRNTVMAIAITVYFVYFVAFGWIVGWIQLIKDINI